ncbi:MAG: metallophosphoesterase [Nanoarchaeota archaeon]
MEILKNIKIVDFALLIDSTLIIADIHIGYEEALNKQGVLVPRLQFAEIAGNMEKIFASIDNKLDKVIINGDLKHEFGTISEQEWRNTLKFLDLLSKHCNEVILIKGNHDKILGPIARKRNVRVLENYVFKAKCGNVLVTHGDKIPDAKLLKEASVIVIGHEHPAISLRDGRRVESSKCFLSGKYNGKNLIVQPSFNTMVPGTDVTRNRILSPLLSKGLDDFRVYIVEDKVYDFGKLGKLRKKMED